MQWIICVSHDSYIINLKLAPWSKESMLIINFQQQWTMSQWHASACTCVVINSFYECRMHQLSCDARAKSQIHDSIWWCEHKVKSFERCCVSWNITGIVVSHAKMHNNLNPTTMHDSIMFSFNKTMSNNIVMHMHFSNII